jgi:hypothetical protein
MHFLVLNLLIIVLENVIGWCMHWERSVVRVPKVLLRFGMVCRLVLRTWWPVILLSPLCRRRGRGGGFSPSSAQKLSHGPPRNHCSQGRTRAECRWAGLCLRWPFPRWAPLDPPLLATEERESHGPLSRNPRSLLTPARSKCRRHEKERGLLYAPFPAGSIHRSGIGSSGGAGRNRRRQQAATLEAVTADRRQLRREVEALVLQCC